MMTRSHSKSSVTIWAGALSLLLIALLGGGCLSKPALKTQLFSFQTPPAATASMGPIVMLRSVTVSPVFDNNSFIYRTGPETYEIDPYASFMAPPAQAISIAVRARLLASGHFRNVVETGSLVQANQVIEINVSELYGDFSQAGKGAAVLSLRLSVYRMDNAGNRRPLLQKDYSRRIALKKNTAADVMAGWDEALSEIMAEFTSDAPVRPRS
ncbi:MAG TPA: ABC-type transport auxiliary lipoprotein family protein [Pseudomonadales bacterium]|nr:ABC-type transport auxiliary lipoprotein family protein [Pseudomonadales bacterium]